MASKATKDEIIEQFGSDSSKASDIVRSLALGGLAIIWLFKNSEGVEQILKPELVLPLLLLAASLATDLIQYIFRSLSIYVFYLTIKKDKRTEFDYPWYVKLLSWTFYILKIVLMAAAYFYIFSFLKERL